MKKVIKFRFNEKEGYLSVTEKNHKFYAIIQKNTPKTNEIEKTGFLEISYELKNSNFIITPVSVLHEKTIIHDTFYELKKENNLYFETLDDTLCVLEIHKS